MDPEEIQTPGENSAAPPPAPSGEWQSNLNAESVSRYFAEGAAAEEEPAAAASGSETPADPEASPETTETPEPALVPSHRLREETEKRRELEERYNPWAPAIEALSQQGYTPEQIQGMIAQAAEAPAAAPPAPQQVAEAQPDAEADPVAEFHAYLARAGETDPYALAAENAGFYDLHHAQFQLNKRLELFEAQAEAQAKQAETQRQAHEQAVAYAQWESDVQAIRTKYSDEPLLQNDQVLHSVIAGYAREHTGAPNREQFDRYVREVFLEPIEARDKHKLQAYAAAKAADAQVPSVAGGSSPPPSPPPTNFHDLKPAEQDRVMRETARRLQAASG